MKTISHNVLSLLYFFTMSNTKKRALISVSDKTNLKAFAASLVSVGYDIISTGGTFKALQEAGLNPIKIDDVTAFPEMMDGRLKTLHPKIHGGLLAKRNKQNHLDDAKAYDIGLIDMVVVNLYPFEQTIQKENVDFDEAIENIDIGGPTMIRSAAKNHESVAVIVNPDRYATIAEELESSQGSLSLESKKNLALEAFEHTAYYDSLIASYLKQQLKPDNHFPDKLSIPLQKRATLRYGENPHQEASHYEMAFDKSAFSQIKQRHGKELSYNNYVDLEAAWQIVNDVKEHIGKACIAIIKHTNPCGCAIADSLSDAYQKALDADPVSAFGSIIGSNQVVDAKTAQLMSTLFVEAIIAPGFEPEALEILTQKKNIRLIEFNGDSHYPVTFKHIAGAMLAQHVDCSLYNALECVTETKEASQDEIAFAYILVKHVKSNAIVLVKDGVSVGVGAGQMSRVEAVEIALKKAGDLAKGSICASDAFFPFGDSVTLLAKAGVKTVVQPGGSKKDQESIDAANTNNMTMFFTKERHFKH